jgi:tetraacyldisaccharide 4'-kinase
VISVGNITLGGTGKTPLVEWLARWIGQRGVRVCIISRGYGAQEGSRNDEALELEQKLPNVPHVQNPNRIEAARRAIEEFRTQVIILDDAFQHRRIHRDLDIVLIDAFEPFGYGHVFPRGLLREPLAGLRRAGLIALSRADMIDAAQLSAIRKQVDEMHPGVPCMELAHAPQSLLVWKEGEQPLDSLAGKCVAAFCGIGNPAGFRHTLEQCGYEVAAWREFPDHHRYSRDDVADLSQWAYRSAAALSAVVCTHKDLVKIALTQLGELPLFAVSVGMRILGGQELLEAKLQPLLDSTRSPTTAP